MAFPSVHTRRLTATQSSSARAKGGRAAFYHPWAKWSQAGPSVVHANIRTMTTELNNRCYMCERLATSREHVPPRCLFPAKKDIGTPDCRTSLITVPSCDIHNTQKSRDDEFLMVSLAGIIGNNSIGYLHKFTKVDRALRRTSGRLLDRAVKAQRIYSVELEENRFLKIVWGTPDAPRLLRCFDHVARGIFFHHFGTRFDGDVKPYLGYLTWPKGNSAEFARFIKHRAGMDLANKQKFGSNPEVFFYQITDTDPFGIRLFHLCFYGGLSVYTSFVPAGLTPPAPLAFELVALGARTIVELEGTKYEFNPEDDEGQA